MSHPKPLFMNPNNENEHFQNFLPAQINSPDDPKIESISPKQKIVNESYLDD